MIINKTSNYKRDLKKLIKKNMFKEITRINNIESLIIACSNLYELLNSPYKTIYYIEKKKGNLKEFYTARINSKLRLVFKPIGNYPYNILEIMELEFIEINTDHYGEG